jgi:hypothetical protein
MSFSVVAHHEQRVILPVPARSEAKQPVIPIEASR